MARVPNNQTTQLNTAAAHPASGYCCTGIASVAAAAAAATPLFF